MTAALAVTGLSVRYGDVSAVEDVDLRVDAGTVVGLLGVNGSGKSSLLSSVVGTVRPARGEIAVHGRPVSEARRAGRVAAVPQSDGIDRDFPVSVRDVVEMGRYARLGPLRRLRRADRDAVESAIAEVGLQDLAARQIGRLSGGQRKRAFVARALAQGAGVLVLDEPFAGVDVPSQETITAVLRSRAAAGAAIVVATHDLEALPRLADRAVLLQRRVVASGPVADVLRPEQLARAFAAPAGGDA